MSKFWESRLWETSSLKGTMLLAALAIADNADDSGVAWPGYILIAKKTRMSLRQVPRIITALESSKEIAVRWGGSRRGDVNIYVFLIGREPSEVAMLQKLVAKKPDKMAVLKACQDVMLNNMPDKMTLKKGHNKHDMGIRETSIEPLNMNGKSMDEWMNDPICAFLLRMPGYNPASLETDRAAIVAHSYSVEGLEYLYADCAGADNPIGLFLYRIGQGQHAPAYLEVLAERKRIAAIVKRPAPAIVPRETVQRIEPDASLTQPLPGHKMTPAEVWQTALGELQMEMTRATFDTWVKPTSLLSVNGTWKIGVPNAYSKEWLDNRLMSTVKRVLCGIVGESVPVEFVEAQR